MDDSLTHIKNLVDFDYHTPKNNIDDFNTFWTFGMQNDKTYQRSISNAQN